MKDKKLRHWHRKKGFSLIELMIVVAIVGLLTMLAVPSYQSYIMKSHRYEAIASLMNIQMAEEKWRTNNASYGTIVQVWGGVTTTEGGHYNLQIDNISATSYTIIAIAEGGQAKDTERDIICTNLVLTVDGATTTRTPAACWNQ